MHAPCACFCFQDADSEGIREPHWQSYWFGTQGLCPDHPLPSYSPGLTFPLPAPCLLPPGVPHQLKGSIHISLPPPNPPAYISSCLDSLGKPGNWGYGELEPTSICSGEAPAHSAKDVQPHTTASLPLLGFPIPLLTSREKNIIAVFTDIAHC